MNLPLSLIGAALAGFLSVSCSTRPDVGKEGAAAAVYRRAASWNGNDPNRYDVAVTEKVGGDGKRYYYVSWTIKQPETGWIAGGLICSWVDPETGDVVSTAWYQ